MRLQGEPMSAVTSGLAQQRLAIREVHRQHGRIVRHIQDLEERLADAQGSVGSDPMRLDLGARVARLQSELAEHFAEEERVGFVPQALARAPRLSRRARDIVLQHERLRVALSRVAAKLQRSTTDWEDVERSFLDFTDALREHERAENALIDEALKDDLGGG